MTMVVSPIGKTVLLVEDDSWLRYIMAELLADDGYEVREAATGTQALALVDEEMPDAVVLDLNLPELSGLDVLHELRTRKQSLNLPVIVMSGALDGETRQRLSRPSERADDVLEKPVDVGRLFECLEQAIVG
jgi:two-component system, OmpR family, phosphate regulon response regulator PhoB